MKSRTYIFQNDANFCAILKHHIVIGDIILTKYDFKLNKIATFTSSINDWKSLICYKPIIAFHTPAYMDFFDVSANIYKLVAEEDQFSSDQSLLLGRIEGLNVADEFYIIETCSLKQKISGGAHLRHHLATIKYDESSFYTINSEPDIDIDSGLIYVQVTSKYSSTSEQLIKITNNNKSIFHLQYVGRIEDKAVFTYYDNAQQKQIVQVFQGQELASKYDLSATICDVSGLTNDGCFFYLNGSTIEKRDALTGTIIETTKIAIPYVYPKDDFGYKILCNKSKDLKYLLQLSRDGNLLIYDFSTNTVVGTISNLNISKIVYYDESNQYILVTTKDNSIMRINLNNASVEFRKRNVYRMLVTKELVGHFGLELMINDDIRTFSLYSEDSPFHVKIELVSPIIEVNKTVNAFVKVYNILGREISADVNLMIEPRYAAEFTATNDYKLKASIDKSGSIIPIKVKRPQFFRIVHVQEHE